MLANRTSMEFCPYTDVFVSLHFCPERQKLGDIVFTENTLGQQLSISMGSDVRLMPHENEWCMISITDFFATQNQKKRKASKFVWFH